MFSLTGSQGMVVTSVFQLLGGLIIAFFYNWKLALVATCVTIPIGLSCAWYRFKYEIHFEKMSAAVRFRSHAASPSPDQATEYMHLTTTKRSSPSPASGPPRRSGPSAACPASRSRTRSTSATRPSSSSTWSRRTARRAGRRSSSPYPTRCRSPATPSSSGTAATCSRAAISASSPSSSATRPPCRPARPPASASPLGPTPPRRAAPRTAS